MLSQSLSSSQISTLHPHHHLLNAYPHLHISCLPTTPAPPHLIKRGLEALYGGLSAAVDLVARHPAEVWAAGHRVSQLLDLVEVVGHGHGQVDVSHLVRHLGQPGLTARLAGRGGDSQQVSGAGRQREGRGTNGRQAGQPTAYRTLLGIIRRLLSNPGLLVGSALFEMFFHNHLIH